MHAENLKKKLLVVVYSLGLLALVFIGLRVVAHIEHAVLLLAASVLLAYLISPMVFFFSAPIKLHVPRRFARTQRGFEATDHLEIVLLRRGLPWVASIGVVYLLMIGVLVLTVSYVLPILIREFKNFVAVGWPQVAADAQIHLSMLKAWLISHLPPEAQEMLPTYFESVGSDVTSWLQRQAYNIPPFVTRLVGTVATLFFVPIMTFYMLMDIHRLKAGFMSIFPRAHRDEVHNLVNRVDDVLGRYIRGQLLVALIMGMSIALVLRLAGIPYALIVGFFAGIANLIPYAGAVLGFIPAVLMAYFVGGFGRVVVVFLGMYAVHLFEGKVVVPTIVGRSVGLPPLVVIFSLIAGAELLGLIGMLIAVPTAGILRVFANHYIEKRNHEESRERLLPRGDYGDTAEREALAQKH